MEKMFLGGSSSGRISVSVGRLIVTENTELFLKKKIPHLEWIIENAEPLELQRLISPLMAQGDREKQLG